MHANANTAPTGANTTLREEKARDFTELYLSASPEERLKISALIDALSFHECTALDGLLSDESLPAPEREILEPLLANVKAALAGARFQPVFTKQQIQAIEANEQPARDAKRRLMLSVLCMTEKRMNHVALNDLEAFADLVELTSDFVAISQAQLDLAEAARNRLMLVGFDHVEVDA